MAGHRGSRLCQVALLWAVLLPLLQGVHGGASTISTDGTRFVDAQGRTVILRGFNLAADAKLPDYRPLKNLTTLNGKPAGYIIQYCCELPIRL